MPDTFTQPTLAESGGRGFIQGRGYRHPFTGLLVPSVTTIVGVLDGGKSNALTHWASNVALEVAIENRHLFQESASLDSGALMSVLKDKAKQKREQARDAGSKVHNALEALVLGEMGYEHLEQDILYPVQCWGEFWSTFVKRPILVEETVWSHEHKYAGTLDLMAELYDGRTAIIDYKTGKEVRESAALQLSALRYADCIVRPDGESPLPAVDVTGVLHIPLAPILTPTGRVSVKGKWSWREVAGDDTQDFKAFTRLREIYEWEEHRASMTFLGKSTQLQKREQTS